MFSISLSYILLICTYHSSSFVADKLWLVQTLQLFHTMDHSKILFPLQFLLRHLSFGLLGGSRISQMLELSTLPSTTPVTCWPGQEKVHFLSNLYVYALAFRLIPLAMSLVVFPFERKLLLDKYIYTCDLGEQGQKAS